MRRRAGLFDLILCRYVAFTYFAPLLQKQVLSRLLERLLPDGYLAIGGEERLPCPPTVPSGRTGNPP